MNMTGKKTTEIKRTITGILSLTMLVFVLFSSFYIVHEVHHDCSGEDCPVCATIRQCENSLNQLCTVLACFIAFILPVFTINAYFLFSSKGFVKETLVSRKVRLDN